MVVGLGNPGERYADTRHNVGFAVVDSLAAQLGVSFKKKLFRSHCIAKASHGGGSFYLVKPLTFMNASGPAVRESLRETGGFPRTCSSYAITCLALGCRFRLRGSSGGQKGLESVISALGTSDFMRLTVGIGRPSHKGKVVGHVLTAPSPDEAALLAQGVEKAVRAVLELLESGPQKVMNAYNRKEESRAP